MNLERDESFASGATQQHSCQHIPMSARKPPEDLEARIAEALRVAQESGELKSAKSYGKPIDFGDGYDDTPAELRMAFKILKDSGYAPAEVQMLQELAGLRKEYAALDPHSEAAQALRAKISEMEVRVAMRIEKLGGRKL